MHPSRAKVADQLVVLGATVTLALHQYDVPSKQSWSKFLAGRSFVLPALIGVAGVFGVFRPFQVASSFGTTAQRVALRQQVLSGLGRLLELAGKIEPPLLTSDLALHVWQKKRTFRHPLRGRLIRLATYRLGAAPATRPFSPPWGVGVVGLCWKHNREWDVDIEALRETCSTPDRFEAFASRNGPDAVMGFSWEEFERFSHRGAVFASPIRDRRGRFKGCLSVDADHGHSQLKTPAFWHEVNSLCILIGQDRFLRI